MGEHVEGRRIVTAAQRAVRRGEIEVSLRHFCRNPRCRSKLPAPVTNQRDAFCTRGCFSSYYLHRCLVCERAMERATEAKRICSRRRCRNELARNRERFERLRYAAATPVARTGADGSETRIKSGLKAGGLGDRPWRIVAGELTPEQLHCASVGAAEAIEAADRTNARHWREHNAEAEHACLIKRGEPPVNILGGYKFPGAAAVDLNGLAEPAPPAAANTGAVPSDWKPCASPITEDLAIPEFLRRGGGR
jgi:hypothetical protein